MPACRSPTSARARTSASWPGRAGSASSPATRTWATLRETWSTRAAGCSAAIAATTASRSVSARASASPPESLYMWCRRTRARTGSWSAPRRSSPPAPCRWPAPSCTATTPRVDRVKLRYRSEPVPCRVVGAAGGDTSGDPARGARRGRRPGPDRMPDGRRPRRRSRHHRRLEPAHKLGRMPPRSSAEIRDAFLSFFEERDHLRVPSASLIPAVLRPIRPAHDRGNATVQALLPGPGPAAAPAAHLLPEVLSHDRHRRGRQHRPPPHLLRDARQLLVRRLLQGGSDRVRVGAVHAGVRPRSGADLDHRVRGRSRARPRPRRGGDRALARDRRAGRAHRPAAPLGELLAGRADGPVRAVLGALHRPGARLRGRGRTPRRRHRALPRVLEPRVHAVHAVRRRPRGARCPIATSTPGSASSGWRRSSRTSPRCTRPTTSGPLVELGEQLSGRALQLGPCRDEGPAGTGRPQPREPRS